MLDFQKVGLINAGLLVRVSVRLMWKDGLKADKQMYAHKFSSEPQPAARFEECSRFSGQLINSITDSQANTVNICKLSRPPH